MSTEMQTKVQASPAQNFIPVQTGLLQKKSALCNTPGLVDDSKQDKEKLTLQRSSANQAGTTTVPPIMLRFGHDFSKVSVHSTRSGMIQTKLISPEHPILQRQEEIDEEEEPLMTKGISSRTQHVRDDLHSRLSQSKGGGKALPDTDRNFMESRFDVDFSDIRLHTNSNAVQMSRELNAQAFTHGRDVYFGAGRYSPGTSSGKRLLAHELTHVVQQDVAKASLRIGSLQRNQYRYPPTRGTMVHAYAPSSAKVFRKPAPPRKTLVPSSSGWTACYSDPRLRKSVCRPTKLRVCLRGYNRTRRRNYIHCTSPISRLSQGKLIQIIDIVSRQLSRYNVSSPVTNILERSRDLLQKEYLRRQGIGRWKNKQWDWATLKAIEAIGPNLMSVTPSDISGFCPKYNQLGNFLRKTFWIYFLSSMAQWESGFKSHLKYREKFMFRGKHVISRGLLQISFHSAKQKRYGCAEIKIANDLHDPVKNLRCGIRILNYWIGRDRRIGGARPWKGGARYWAVLRQRRTSRSLPVIKNWTKRLPFCK